MAWTENNIPNTLWTDVEGQSTSWNDPSTVNTVWTKVDESSPEGSIITILQGTPMGISLVFTYTQIQTITANNQTWSEPSKNNTLWTEV